LRRAKYQEWPKGQVNLYNKKKRRRKGEIGFDLFIFILEELNSCADKGGHTALKS
jgi:hypothetical protein